MLVSRRVSAVPVVVENRCGEEGPDASERTFLKKMEKPNMDKEGRWVRKVGRLRFGFKCHTVVDINDLTIAEETTVTNE